MPNTDSSILGLDAKLYIASNDNWDTPTWVEIDLAKDVTLNMEKATTDVSVRRSNGWRAMRGTLKNGTVEFTMLYVPSDTAFDLLQSAFFANNTVLIAVMDGAINVNGSEGLKMWCDITNFTRNENLEEALMVDVSLVPAPTAADEVPDWVTSSGSSLV